MKSEGSAHHVGGQESVPLPSGNQKIAPRVPDVVCHCSHRGRAGAFHICIVPPVPEPTPPPKPAPPRAKRPAAKRTPTPAGEATKDAGSRRKGRAPILTDEQSAEAARMYVEDGLPVSDVADHFGVSSKAIRTAMKRQGVPARPTGLHRPGRGAA